MVVVPNEENLLFSNSHALIVVLYIITICLAVYTQIHLMLQYKHKIWCFSAHVPILEWGELMGSKVCFSVVRLFLIGVLAYLAGVSTAINHP